MTVLTRRVGGPGRTGPLRAARRLPTVDTSGGTDVLAAREVALTRVAVGRLLREDGLRGLRHPTSLRLFRPGLLRSVAGLLGALLVAAVAYAFHVGVGGAAPVLSVALPVVALVVTASATASLVLRVVVLVRGLRLIRAGRRELALSGTGGDRAVEDAAVARLRAPLAAHLSWVYRRDPSEGDANGRDKTGAGAIGLAAAATAAGGMGMAGGV